MHNKKSRFQLFDKFRQGAIPSGADFANLIQSSVNVVDDGLDIPEDSLQPIRVRGRDEAGHLFDFCDQDWQVQWRLSQANLDESGYGFHLTANNQSRFYIDHTSGNVGLSFDQPAARLHIRQVGNQDCLRIDDQDGDDSPFIVDSQGKTGVGVPVPAARLHVSNTGADDSFRVDDKRDAGDPADDSPFVIKNDGNVGIGYHAPIAKLAINGGLNIGDTQDPGASNVNIEGQITVKQDSYLGTSDTDKVVLPGNLQSIPEPNTTSSLVINDSLQVNRNIGVIGDAQFGSSLDNWVKIAGSTIIGKDLTVDNDVLIGGNLTIQGDVIARDTQHVDGDVVLGDEDIDTITIEGRLVSGHSSDQLQIDDTVHIAQALNVTGVSTFSNDVISHTNVILGSADTHVTTLTGELRSGHSSGALQMKDAVEIAETLQVSGDVTFASNTTLGSVGDDTVNVKGSATVEQNITVHKDVAIHGTLTIDGAVVARNTQHVEGDVLLGNQDMDKVTITGDLVTGHSSGALQIASPVNIHRSLSVGDSATISADLSVSGHATLGNADTDKVVVAGYLSTGHSTGSLQLNDIVHVTRDLNVSGSANVTQHIRCTQSLTVHQDTGMFGDLAVSGEVTLGGSETARITITGALKSGRADNHLLVDETAKFTGDIVINGAIRSGATNNTVVISNDVDIDGSIMLKHGGAVNRISGDSALAENSHQALATQNAVKSYVDNQISNSSVADRQYIDTKIAALRAEVTALQTQVAALQGQVNSNLSNLTTKINTDVAALTTTVNSNFSALDTKIDTEVEKLDSDIDGLTIQLTEPALSIKLNEFDGQLNYPLGKGQVMVGLKSNHNNHHEDREWWLYSSDISVKRN